MPPTDGSRPTAVSASLRRWLYEALVPLDKGDFRWEFLVPWNNKTLTTLDKFIVCSTFIGVSFIVQTVFDPGASVGVHLSYIAQFFSYAMGDPIGFRLLAVLTAVLEIGGNLFERKAEGFFVNGADFNLINAFANVNEEDVFPIFYDQLFIVINGYYILRWLLTQEALASALEWEADEEALYANCLAPLGFRRAQFSRLLRSATFELATEATALTVQGEPLYDLFVPLNGTVEVRVGGAVASTLPPYQLVGEASLLEHLQSPGGALHPPARATVVAAPGSYYVRWPQRSFYEMQQEEDSDFSYAIQLMIARTLSQKLSAARLSQRSAEQRLQQGVAARLRGVAPRAGPPAGADGEERDGAASASAAAAAAAAASAAPAALVEAPPARERPGAAARAEAEVAALLQLSEERADKAKRLEAELAATRTELADYKLILGVLLGAVALQAAASLAVASVS